MKTIPAKKILTRTKPNNLFWFGYDYTINLYRGCCHGCIYCDSRSNCYHIDNFDQVCLKENALQILNYDLSRCTKRGVVATGAMSDPYNPFEKKELVTRHMLELLHAYEFGASIATKSDLVTRDIDILQDIKRSAPVLCKLTITTPYDDLSQKIEPHVATSSQRFAALKNLAKQNIFCGVLLMPVLPFLEDSVESIELLVQKSAEAGARFIYADFGVTMREGQREYFLAALNNLFPEKNLAQKYTAKYGYRYHCASPHYKKLWDAFTNQCDAYGLLYKMQDIISAYKQGYSNPQLSFL